MNTYSGTYTFAANDTGGTKDLGAKHTYRYVNATNVYGAGWNAGQNAFYSNAVIDQDSTSFNNPHFSWKNDWGKDVVVVAVCTACSFNNFTLDAKITVSGTNTVYVSYDSATLSNTYSRTVFKVIKLANNSTITLHTWADPAYARRETLQCVAMLG